MNTSNKPRQVTTARRTQEGRWLYRERLRRGLRQSDVAAILQCNGGRISEWEQGLRLLPPDVKAKLKQLKWV